MDPSVVRSFASPHFYANPFWSDRTDPARDGTCQRAAEEYQRWQPIRVNRIRTAVLVYLGLWVLDLVLLVQWFSWPNGGNGAEPVAVPAAVLFLALFTVIPWLLYLYVDGASKHTRGAVNAIAGSSYARYQAWLDGLQRTDMALYSQIILWHQGESARQLQQYQLALQAFNTYQLHRIRRDLPKH